MPKKPFASYVHPTSRDDGKVDRGTNQRMAFGLDLGGRWIVGGDKVCIFPVRYSLLLEFMRGRDELGSKTWSYISLAL